MSVDAGATIKYSPRRRLGLAGPILGAVALAFLVFIFGGGKWKRENKERDSGRVLTHDERAGTGPILVAPLGARATYLIDRDGYLVHQWESQRSGGGSALMLSDGSVLRAAMAGTPREFSGVRGATGCIERIGRDGKLLWQFVLASPGFQMHDGFDVLPNGNVLLLAWERRVVDSGDVAAGESPAEKEQWIDTILEVKPDGRDGGQVVWRWRSDGHFFSAANESYQNGEASKQPEQSSPFGASDETSGRTPLHFTSVSYHPSRDQILVNSLGSGEVWVIDRAVSRSTSAPSEDGKEGGSDLVYRWGNPAAWGMKGERKLFGQQFATWVDRNEGGAAILIFNNRTDDSKRVFSSILELRPANARTGDYLRTEGEGFGPKRPHWYYAPAPPERFLVAWGGSAQRLSNGNTLIASSPDGRIFEVTPEGEMVWDFRWSPEIVAPQSTSEGPSAVPEPPKVPGVWPIANALEYSKEFVSSALSVESAAEVGRDNIE